jgi:hypothetical protein
MKRILVAIAAILIVIVMGGLIYFASSSRHQERVNAPRLFAAAKAYAESFKAQGVPVPASVSLKELISRGLLTDSDVSGFAGMEVTISLTANETRPQEALVRARLTDGHEIVLLVDGSVHQVKGRP